MDRLEAFRGLVLQRGRSAASLQSGFGHRACDLLEPSRESCHMPDPSDRRPHKFYFCLQVEVCSQSRLIHMKTGPTLWQDHILTPGKFWRTSMYQAGPVQHGKRTTDEMPLTSAGLLPDSRQQHPAVGACSLPAVLSKPRLAIKFPRLELSASAPCGCCAYVQAEVDSLACTSSINSPKNQVAMANKKIPVVQNFLQHKACSI